eukprot:scaffold159_cov92-Cylindrotheca_fusiformis.AAC.1
MENNRLGRVVVGGGGGGATTAVMVAVDVFIEGCDNVFGVVDGALCHDCSERGKTVFAVDLRTVLVVSLPSIPTKSIVRVVSRPSSSPSSELLWNQE